MSKFLSKTILPASFALALALTLSCSSGGGGDNPPVSSSDAGISSSSGDVGDSSSSDVGSVVSSSSVAGTTDDSSSSEAGSVVSSSSVAGTGDSSSSSGEKTLGSIAVTTHPAKTQYNLGEELNTAGLVVTATYSDGSSVPVTGYTVSGYNKNIEDNQIITVAYQGKTATFEVSVIDPTLPTPSVGDYTIGGIGAIAYDGSAKTVTVTKKDGKSTGTVTVKYNDIETAPVNAGTYAVTFDVAQAAGWNAISGLSAGTLTISPKVATLTVDAITAQTWTGSAITPSVTVKDGATTLPASNYTVAYSSNTNLGTATVTIAGAGNYAGSTGSKTFTINPKATTFTVEAIPAQTWTGSAITPSVTVKDGGTTLTLATHYTVAYSSNSNLGTATVTIAGAGNYAGSTGSTTFTISPKVTTLAVDEIPAQPWTGSEIKPSVTVKDGATTLALGTHYAVAYSSNSNAGTATVTIAGAGNYAGSTGSATFTIIPKDITFTVEPISAVTYTGSAFTPVVTVKDGATTLALTTHYTVAYADNTDAGTATVTITGAGNYAGSTGSATFAINKAAGAAVSAPTLASISGNSIAINAVAEANVEYGISTTNTAPASWQDGLTFSGISGVSNNYIFARSKGDANHTAGEASASLLVPLCGNTTPYDPSTKLCDVRDGKTYGKVPIGTQTWMSENLNYVVDDGTGSKCANNIPSNCDIYGRLYNWATAMGSPATNTTLYGTTCGSNCYNPTSLPHQGICPDGWHIPTDAEWTTLTTYAGDLSTAGRKLKAASASGDDNYGFSALLGGYGNSDGSFDGVGSYGLWWSATESIATSAWYRGMYSSGEGVSRDYLDKSYLGSVRCAQD